ALGLGSLTLLLSAGISFLVEHLAAESSVRQIGYQLAERAAETRDRFDAGIYERLRDMRVLTGAHSARSTRPDRADLEELRQRQSTFAWVAYADLSGRVLAAAQGLLEGADVSQRSWFKGGLQGSVVEDVHRDGLWPQHLEPARFIALAAPVRDGSG